MQFFIQPGTELDWFAKWKETRMKWHQNLGFGAENYRFHDHDKLAHYANAAGRRSTVRVSPFSSFSSS